VFTARKHRSVKEVTQRQLMRTRQSEAAAPNRLTASAVIGRKRPAKKMMMEAFWNEDESAVIIDALETERGSRMADSVGRAGRKRPASEMTESSTATEVTAPNPNILISSSKVLLQLLFPAQSN